jgi:hypothetical protein
MNEEMTKTELLEQIRNERRALETTLSQLTREQMLQPGVEGAWSVKDILIHVVVWEQRMVSWVNQSLSGEPVEMLPPGLTWDDLDRWNEDTYLKHKDDSLVDVLAQLTESYQQVLSTVSSVDEVALLDPERFSWREGRPLWLVVAANTSWHYKDHNTSIRSWLEGG